MFQYNYRRYTKLQLQFRRSNDPRIISVVIVLTLTPLTKLFGWGRSNYLMCSTPNTS